jgi:glycosyltransferase involved in cell wall biosynthesis
MADHPRFSIIIPTRERAETLPFALQTVLTQDFDDFEAIVHDNCSSAETRQVVDGITSDKLKYFRSDVPLAMTDAWERALSFATGEYVVIIGDDDGLLPHALRILDQLLRERQARAVRWARVSYHWPSHPFPTKRNSLKIPLGNRGHIMPGREIIRKVVNMDLPFFTLPMVYNSVVHRDVLAELKAKCGRVFFSPSPDLGSGYAIAYQTERYLSLETPFSIGGISGKSNGLALISPSDEGASVADDFRQLNAKAGITPHAKLPKLYLMPQIVADSYYHVQDALFAQDRTLDPDRKDHIRATVRDLKSLSPGDAVEGLKKLRESLADSAHLLKWFDREIASQPLPDSVGISMSKSPRGFVEREKILALEPLDFGVTDVYGASQLCEKILNYGRDGFRCQISDYFASPKRQVREVGRMLWRRGAPTLPDCD